MRIKRKTKNPLVLSTKQLAVISYVHAGDPYTGCVTRHDNIGRQATLNSLARHGLIAHDYASVTHIGIKELGKTSKRKDY